MVLILCTGGEGTDEREGLELLAGVLEKFSGQYKALLASLQEKHEFQLEQLLRSGLDLCGPRRHRRMVRSRRRERCLFVSKCVCEITDHKSCKRVL